MHGYLIFGLVTRRIIQNCYRRGFDETQSRAKLKENPLTMLKPMKSLVFLTSLRVCLLDSYCIHLEKTVTTFILSFLTVII